MLQSSIHEFNRGALARLLSAHLGPTRASAVVRKPNTILPRPVLASRRVGYPLSSAYYVTGINISNRGVNGRYYTKKRTEEEEFEDEYETFLNTLNETDEGFKIPSKQDHLALEQFMDQTVEDKEWTLDEMPPDVKANYLAKLALEEEFRLRNALESTPEYNMAMGLSSYRQPGKKGVYQSPKTKADELLKNKLEENSAVDGSSSLSKKSTSNISFANGSLEELEELDYESLKSFATEHELNIEDFFTTTKTKDGELQTLSLKFGGSDGLVVSEGVDFENPTGLVEHSYQYLKAGHRSNPKHFRDRIRVRCEAGLGGRGGVSFYRDTRVAKGPPDGGDGGSGGNIIFVASENRKPSLTALQPAYRAENGGAGSGGRKRGKTGRDIVIEVPLGTSVTEFRSKPKNQDESDESAMNNKEHQEFLEEQRKLAQQHLKDIVHHPLYASESQTTESELQTEDLSPEEIERVENKKRLQREAAHRALHADPREGRPWAPPTLEPTHPMHKASQEFHRMIESYHKNQSTDSSSSTFGSESINELDANTSSIDSESFRSLDIAEPILPFANHKLGGAKLKQQQQQAKQQQEQDRMLKEYQAQFQDIMDPEDQVDLVEKYRLKTSEKPTVGAANQPRRVDLDEPGAFFVAARGGAGGLGNWRLGAVRGRPQAVATPGKSGEQLMYELELKLIADVGIVGFPNAGKSTFLSNASRANPKIASYPFTTLCPEIGTIETDDYTQFTIADLPGLVEGAHMNRGLGHSFLRHIERTSALIYMIDMSGGDARDPWTTFLTLWDELERYQAGLARRPAIIVANKMDQRTQAQANLKDFAKRLKADKTFKNLKIYPISAASNLNITGVIQALRKLLGLSEATPTQKLQSRLHKASKTGIITVNSGSHLSEAMKNISTNSGIQKL